MTSVQPYEHAVEGLSSLVDQYNLDLWYLSNRNPELQDVLTIWLHNNEFPQWHQSIALPNKHIWINRYYPDIVIDDRVKTMVHAWSLDMRVFGIKQPWNCNLKREIEGITICDDWVELSQGLDAYLSSNLKLTELLDEPRAR